MGEQEKQALVDCAREMCSLVRKVIKNPLNEGWNDEKEEKLHEKIRSVQMDNF